MTDSNQFTPKDNHQLSILLERAIPGFIQDDYDTFVQFLRGYYEWMEDQFHPTHIALKLQDHHEIDRTIDEYFVHLEKELSPLFPSDMAMDKGLFLKRVRDFYSRKGNEESIKFVFQALYDDSVSVSYPRDQVLKASDGTWSQPMSMKISFDNPHSLSLVGNQIIGKTSGAKAIVERATIYDQNIIVIKQTLESKETEFALGDNDGDALATPQNDVLGFSDIEYFLVDNPTEEPRKYIELFLTNIRGNFLPDEEIEAEIENVIDNTCFYDVDKYEVKVLRRDGTIGFLDRTIKVTETIIGTVTRANVDAPGKGYVVGTTFQLRNAQGSVRAVAEVTATDKAPIKSLSIVDGGKGYSGDTIVANRFATLPVQSFYDGVFLPDEKVSDFINRTSDSNGEKVVDFTISTTEIPSTGDTVTFESVSGNGTGGFARVKRVDDDGTILSVALLSKGRGYDIPHAVVDTKNGENATFNIECDGGGIISVQLKASPVAKETLTADFGTAPGAGAQISFEEGAVFKYPGAYLNEDGMPSSSRRLQDNRFYQDYSYVISSSKGINDWRDIVKKIVHPAGFMLFGYVYSGSALKLPMSTHKEFIFDMVKDVDLSSVYGGHSQLEFSEETRVQTYPSGVSEFMITLEYDEATDTDYVFGISKNSTDDTAILFGKNRFSGVIVE